jgi:hypothetical protein
MNLSFQPREAPAAVAAKLAEAIPSLKVKQKKVWGWELQLELPNKITVSIHSSRVRSGWGSRGSENGVLEKITVVYDSDYYNGYKSRDTFRRSVQFKHNGTHNAYEATEVKIDVAALREKLSEVMTFAEHNEARLAQRRETLTAAEHHAKERARNFKDRLIAEGLEKFPVSPSDLCIELDHDAKKDMDRPVKIALRMDDDDAIQVIALVNKLLKK